MPFMISIYLLLDLDHNILEFVCNSDFCSWSTTGNAKTNATGTTCSFVILSVWNKVETAAELVNMSQIVAWISNKMQISEGFLLYIIKMLYFCICIICATDNNWSHERRI